MNFIKFLYERKKVYFKISKKLLKGGGPMSCDYSIEVLGIGSTSVEFV